jgi:hypothetical protein
MWGAPSDYRVCQLKLLLDLASAVILGSEVYETVSKKGETLPSDGPIIAEEECIAFDVEMCLTVVA